MITLNGELWYILQVPEIPNNILGVCDYPSKTIFIKDNLRPDKFQQVLIHELVHALLFSYKIEIDIASEELLADFIATYGKEIIDISDMYINKNRGEA